MGAGHHDRLHRPGHPGRDLRQPLRWGGRVLRARDREHRAGDPAQPGGGVEAGEHPGVDRVARPVGGRDHRAQPLSGRAVAPHEVLAHPQPQHALDHRGHALGGRQLGAPGPLLRPAEAGRRARRRQAAYPLRGRGGNGLRDRPAQRQAHQVEGVERGEHLGDHAVHRLRRPGHHGRAAVAVVVQREHPPVVRQEVQLGQPHPVTGGDRAQKDHRRLVRGGWGGAGVGKHAGVGRRAVAADPQCHLRPPSSARAASSSRSSTAARPCPPPMHMVTSARRPPVRASRWPPTPTTTQHATPAARARQPVAGGDQHARARRPHRVAQRDARAQRVEALVLGVQAPLVEHGQRLGGERLVELDEVHLIQGEPEPVEHLGGGRHRPDAHRLRGDPGHGPARQPGGGGKPQLRRAGPRGHHHRRRAVVLPGGVAGGHRGLRVGTPHDRAQPGERVGGGVRARMLVAVDHHVLALAPRHCHGHDLGVEGARLLRGDGPGMAARGQRVLGGAADRVGPPQVLGRLDHAAGDRVPAPAGLLAGLGEPVAKDHVAALLSPAHIGVHGVLGARHALRAAGDDQPGGPGGDVRGGGGHGLQPGAAAAVQLHAGHRFAQPGVEGDHPAQRRRGAVGGRPGRG